MTRTSGQAVCLGKSFTFAEFRIFTNIEIRYRSDETHRARENFTWCSLIICCKVMDWLRNRIGKLEAVVFSGGEALMQGSVHNDCENVGVSVMYGIL